MKRNKILLLCVMLLSTVALTGCFGVKNITDEESDLIAEYSAGVLLRYSNNYQWRLLTKEQASKEDGSDVTETPQPSALPSDEPQETAAAESPTGDQTASQTDPQSTDTGSDSQEPDIKNVSLNEVYGTKGVDITMDHAKYCKKYKNIQVMSNSDDKLLVITFKLHNTSGTAKKINLMKREIDYPITIGTDTYFLGINILEGNDMKYLKTTIPAGKTVTAALVYTLPSSVKTSDEIRLIVQEKDKTEQASYDIKAE